MLHHVVAGHAALAKRYIDDETPSYQLPGWAFFVVLADLIIFVPVFLFVTYTLATIVPVLAIIEDPNPPAYEPVALNEDSRDNAGEPAFNNGKPVTSSLRATRRLLSGVAGWTSYFRGIGCAIVLAIADSSLNGILSSRLPLGRIDSGFGDIQVSLLPLGSLLASLALVQLHTAWTHIVISGPSKRPFYRRLPAFRKTFEATCFPILAAWAASALSSAVPALLRLALGLKFTTPNEPPKDGETPLHHAASDFWKAMVILVVNVVLILVVVVPTLAVLVRVQASLLPPEEDTIVPFDRSFGGKVEPPVVGGKGYISMKEALTTLDRASWVRIYKVFGKVVAVGVAVYFAFCLVLGVEAVLIFSSAKKI